MCIIITDFRGDEVNENEIVRTKDFVEVSFFIVFYDITG